MKRKIGLVLILLAALSALVAAQQPVPYSKYFSLASGAYLNFGSSAQGDAGYGFRDSGGTLQVKSLGGAWANINSGYTDATIRALFSSSATGLTYTASTGVFSFTAGYSIPNQALTSADSPTFDSLTLGSAADGGNAVINSKETELITSPMVTGGWTLGFDTGGWSITAGVLSKTASTGTQTATAVTGMTAAPVAGTEYLVTAVVSAASGNTTWNLGNTTIPQFSAPGTYSYVVTAANTSKLYFQNTASATVTITSLSVKEIETTSGNATVENDTTSGRFLAKMGSAGYPAFSFANDTDTGMYTTGVNTVVFAAGGVGVVQVSGGGIYHYATNPVIALGGSSDVVLLRDGAANTLALRNGTAQQKFNLYNTYTDASNYERLALTGVAGASGNLTMETAGTGGDNLDIIATPAGTGSLKSATNLVHSGTPDVISSAGAISVNTAISHVVTNGAGTVLTLAAGKEGQVKYIVLKTLTSGGQTDVITPDGGGAGYTTITMSAVGHAVTLLFTNGKWTVVGYFGCVIA